jgi:hypothetical protein
MRLAAKRRLMRIRQTIYEDPGNPFADDLEEKVVGLNVRSFSDKPLPPQPGILEDDREPYLGPDAHSVNGSQIEPPTPKNPIAVASSNDAFRVGRRGIPNSVRTHHRRSKSVAVPLPSPTHDSGEYISPRQFWRQGSAPAVQPLQEEEAEDVRNTKFYGFYDDIMNSYRGRDSKL